MKKKIPKEIKAFDTFLLFISIILGLCCLFFIVILLYFLHMSLLINDKRSAKFILMMVIVFIPIFSILYIKLFKSIFKLTCKNKKETKMKNLLNKLRACMMILRGKSFTYNQKITSKQLKNCTFISCEVKKNEITRSKLEKCNVELKGVVKVKQQKKKETIQKPEKEVKKEKLIKEKKKKKKIKKERKPEVKLLKIKKKNKKKRK